MRKKVFSAVCFLTLTLALSACAHPCGEAVPVGTEKTSPIADKIVADEPPDYLPEQPPQQPTPAAKKGTP